MRTIFIDKMKRTTLILFFLHAFFVLHSQNVYEKDVDLILSQMEGEEKLLTLRKLQQSYLNEPGDQYYNSLLLEEAKKQNNIKYQSIALTSQVAYQYRNFDNDSIFYYADIAEQYCKQQHECRCLFEIRQILIYRYLDQGNYNLGLKKAMLMNQEVLDTKDPIAKMTALLTLAKAYQALGMDELAIKFFNESLRIYTPDPEAVYKLLECYLYLSASYNNLNDKEKFFLYTDSLELIYEEVVKSNSIFNLRDFRISIYLNKAQYFIDKGQLDSAVENIQKAEDLISIYENPHFIFLLDETKMYYYKAIGNLEEMRQKYKICYDYCEQNNLENEIQNLMRFKAITLGEMGMHDAAVYAFKQLELRDDSINVERFVYEFNNLGLNYEIDKREDIIDLQETELRLRTKLNIFQSIIFVFLLIFCLIILYYNRMIRNKNKYLFSQIKEITQRKRELTFLKNSIGKEELIVNDISNQDRQLFSKIENLMTTEHPYTQPEYGRKDLIADMETNENYLASAIKTGTGMTVNEYLNNLRLDYSLNLLKDYNLTIEAIADMSGFNSSRTFYRLFKDKFGMSPHYFRKYVDLENVNNET